jgi:signal transduction histidine kinase
MADEVRRLNAMLDEFRAFRKIPVAALATVDVVALLADFVDIHVRPALGPSVALELDISDELPAAQLDAAKLTQVLLNLVRNALEAMQDRDQGTLTLRAEIHEERLQIDIGDTGVGIAAASDPFAMFVTSKPDGTGLGLAIARQIISAHGGTLTFESEPGVGTTFSIALPIGRRPGS